MHTAEYYSRNLLNIDNDWQKIKIKAINEAGGTLQTQFRDKHLQVRLPDVEDFIKKNDAKEVTNPVFFVRDGIPTSDGLLSNELFGITR